MNQESEVEKAYREKSKEVINLAKTILANAKDWDRQDHVNWSHVGSACKMAELLKDVLEFQTH
jgi:hypothetical protein